MVKLLLPNATIGIIGGGQLGKMMAQAAQKLGYNVAIYDPNPESCAFSLAHWHQVASFDNKEALLDFAKKVDVLTYEFENINGQILNELVEITHVPQGAEFLLISQNRLKEKEWLKSIGVPVVDFEAVTDDLTFEKAIKAVGLPSILKTNRLGYDGNGQMLIESAYQKPAIEVESILEKKFPFAFEVSVIISRDQYDNIHCFPIGQNVHHHGILKTTLVPAKISDAVEQKIHEFAHKIAQKAKLVGVCGIEFFVSKDDEVVVNELAPRPHNTGHYSIEGCNVSQFEQHILAICGRKIQKIQLWQPTLMVNILGEDLEQTEMIIKEFPTLYFHNYNKGQARPGRKMGHFTLMDSSFENLEEIAKNFFEK